MQGSYFLNYIMQLFLAVILAVVLVILATRISYMYVFAGFVMIGAFGYLYHRFFRGYDWFSFEKLNRVPLLLVYLTLIFSFTGSALPILDVGPITLFPDRILLPITAFFFLMQMVRRDSHIWSWQDIQVKPMILFFGGWLFYALFSLSWVHSVTLGIRGFIFLTLGIVLIFFTVFYFKYNDYVNLFYIWIGMIVVLTCVGVWENITERHLPSSSLVETTRFSPDIPTGFFYNQNDYASFLALSVFFVFALLKYAKSKLLKINSLILLFILIYLIYVTESRANYLAVAVGFLFCFLFFTTRLQKWTLLVVGFVAFVLAMLLFHEKILVLYSNMIEKFSFLFGDFDSSLSGGIRINFILYSVLFVVRTFGFGVGSGNIEYYMGHYVDFYGHQALSVHNWWIEILANYGIITFVGYVLIYFTLIIKIYAHYRRLEDQSLRMVCEGVLGSLAAFSLASISPSTILTLKYQWVLIAFAVGLLHYLRINSKQKRLLDQ